MALISIAILAFTFGAVFGFTPNYYSTSVTEPWSLRWKSGDGCQNPRGNHHVASAKNKKPSTRISMRQWGWRDHRSNDGKHSKNDIEKFRKALRLVASRYGKGKQIAFDAPDDNIDWRISRIMAGMNMPGSDQFWKEQAQTAHPPTPEPHSEYEGLWVGNFGEEGPKLINVTVSDNVLVATALSCGDFMYPGEQVFSANLGGEEAKTTQWKNNNLDSIKLSPEAAEKWGVNELERYPAAARDEYSGKQVKGQLILFQDRFSFVWIPSGRHVFFHRPSPETMERTFQQVVSDTPQEDDDEDDIESQRRALYRAYNLDGSELFATEVPRDDEEENGASVVGDPLVNFFARKAREEDDKAKEQEEEEEWYWQ